MAPPLRLLPPVAAEPEPDAKTVPYATSDRELADDAEAAARRDGDLRRLYGGRRGVDAAPALAGLLGAVVALVVFAGVVALARVNPSWELPLELAAACVALWWGATAWGRR